MSRRFAGIAIHSGENSSLDQPRAAPAATAAYWNVSDMTQETLNHNYFDPFRGRAASSAAAGA